MKRSILFIAILGLALFGATLSPASAQEKEETVRVRTRVVFLDALVTDKHTNGLVSDLKKENFEVLADGRPRPISYFTREGDMGRKPLALILVLDLRRDGAGRFLRRTEILEAMSEALQKLSPEDEVGIMVIEAGSAGDKRMWLTHLTRDRSQAAAALSVVPVLVAEGNSGGGEAENPPETNDKAKSEGSRPGDASGAKTKEKKQTKPRDTAGAPTKSEDTEIESETKTVWKDGSVVTRTVYKSGRVQRKRVSKNGKVTAELDDDDMDLVGATTEAVNAAARERPNSQTAIVWVSDGITPIFYAERDETESVLVRSNAIYSALVVDMKTGYKLLLPVVKPITDWVGLSIYGSSQHIARETGGEVARVRRPADYMNGLNKIIGNLTGRYSLGFTLAEAEQDDGQMHQLEVRVKARDAKDRERRLTVNARRGYYLPKKDELTQR